MAEVALQVQTKEPIKRIRAASNSTKHCAHQHMQSDKMKIIQHTDEAFYRTYSDVTPFVIIYIFKSTFHLITHSSQ